ncbi:beta-lactamase-like protein [Chytriomyces sp. MP71]|nr:beta-lactamase-like protein [Chytriomyces sp. MP71]
MSQSTIAHHIDPHSLSFVAIPDGSATVTVKVLVNGRFSADPRLFVLDSDPGEKRYPVLCFLVERGSGDGTEERLLFDLGIRKDHQKFSPITRNTVLPFFPIHDAPDVAENLATGGLAPADVSNVILSHDHYDHIGDPLLFPLFTRFSVGDFGTDDEGLARLHRRDGSIIPWRKLLQDPSLFWQPLGTFERAHDYFGDGSFWIIDAPGHCKGHIMAMARSTASPNPTYILFAGDAAHSKCLYSPCPEPHHPESRSAIGLYTDGYKCGTGPRCDYSVHEDTYAAYKTIAALSRMDSLDNVLVIAAHETGVEGTVDLYPRSANDWKRKGWKEAIKVH